MYGGGAGDGGREDEDYRRAFFCDRDTESDRDTGYISASGGADRSFLDADQHGRYDARAGVRHGREVPYR